MEGNQREEFWVCWEIVWGKIGRSGKNGRGEGDWRASGNEVEVVKKKDFIGGKSGKVTRGEVWLGGEDGS